MDTDGLLNDLNEVVWNEEVIFPDDSQMPAMQGLDVNLPQASAYIFSVVPPGPLPEEFWGHKHHHYTQSAATDSDQSCSIFKVCNVSFVCKCSIICFFFSKGSISLSLINESCS